MTLNPEHTILDLERQLGEHAEEMMRLSRDHARGENVAADKLHVQAANRRGHGSDRGMRRHKERG